MAWYRFPIVFKKHPEIRDWLEEYVGAAGSYRLRTGSWAWDLDHESRIYHVCIPDRRMALLYKLTWG